VCLEKKFDQLNNQLENSDFFQMNQHQQLRFEQSILEIQIGLDSKRLNF